MVNYNSIKLNLQLHFSKFFGGEDISDHNSFPDAPNSLLSFTLFPRASNRAPPRKRIPCRGNATKTLLREKGDAPQRLNQYHSPALIRNVIKYLIPFFIDLLRVYSYNLCGNASAGMRPALSQNQLEGKDRYETS